MTLRVELLGPPKFFLGGGEITFSFRKAQALACYLLVERRVSREVLADLFWGDRDDGLAAKNLRNALYKLRKQLPTGTVKADRQWISLGNVPVDLDLDRIEHLKEIPHALLYHYGRPFMEGFMLPDCSAFEDWLRENRSRFSRIYRDKLKALANDSLVKNNLKEALRFLDGILENDDLDEEAYRMLMTCHSGLGHPAAVAKVYRRMKDRLRDELDVAPSEETESLYLELLPRERHGAIGEEKGPLPEFVSEKVPFFGREGELARIGTFCEEAGKAPRCVLVYGEAGVGKSALVSRFLENVPDGSLVLSCEAAQGEGRYSLLPWNDLLGELPSLLDMDGLEFPSAQLSLLGESFPSLGNGTTSSEPASATRIGGILADLFRRISVERGVYLLMEDIQRFDEASLEILESLLLHRPGDVRLLFTARPDVSGQGESMLRSLSLAGRIELCRVGLQCFTLGDMEGFCRQYLPGRTFTDEEMIRLFRQTEGLPLFLAELLRLIGSGRSMNESPESLSDAIEGILARVSEEERSLLECLSVFFGRAEWGLLLKFFDVSEARLTGMTDRLKGLSVLVERVEEERKLYIEFGHIKVKEHVQASMSVARRRLLHRRLAELLMESLAVGGWNDLICSRIVAHCRKAGMKIEELDYTIRKLRIHIKLHYELFPLFDDRVLRNVSTAFEGRTHTMRQLRDIRSLLSDIREKQGDSERIRALEMSYRTILGGYMLWWGEYSQGERFIRAVLERAGIVGDADLEAECLQHLCYYGIQIEDGDLLESYARLLLEVARKNEDGPVQAMCFRFLGLAHLFRKNFLSAEKNLTASIDMFEELEFLGEPFSLQKAAALNYLGSISHRSGHFQEAMSIYEQCLKRCEDQGIFRGGCIFHSNAAHVAYDMGNGDLMRRHLLAARGDMEECQWWRGNSILFSLMALVAVEEGDEEGAVDWLRRADELCIQLNKRYWLALQFWVKGCLKRQALPDGPLSRFLPERAEVYLGRAGELYGDMGVSYMVERSTLDRWAEGR